MNVSRSRPFDDKASEHHQRHINIYALPSESRTWTLIRRYFLKTGQLLPFIHEQAFCETYFEMKRNNFTRIRRTWLGLLNIIMAIATSLAIDDDDEDIPAQKRIEESDIYYQRANGLCGREAVRSASLEMGMCLLTTSLFYGLTDTFSAILFDTRAVSARNAKVRAGMEYTWIGRHGRVPVRAALAKSQSVVFAAGTGDPKEDLVWLRAS